MQELISHVEVLLAALSCVCAAVEAPQCIIWGIHAATTWHAASSGTMIACCHSYIFSDMREVTTQQALYY